jgi:glycosyltransferase involved in cell wall biosynthesis
MPRSAIGIPYDSFVLVYSGRLTEEKGVLQLVHAVQKLDNISNIRLLILGGGSYGDNLQQTAFTKKLEEETVSLNGKAFFTGYINYANIPAYLKIADLAVVPSIWDEPFGLTVVEAMAAGLPLITTRSGGNPEICENIATIVERENIVDNLANAILDLYQHPEKREAMAKASLKQSLLFDKETYAKNLFNAIENI